MILESVEHGPLIWPTVEENEVTRTKKYAELSASEKIQADCDMKATNIILQGLPADIYSLVNHHRVAKDLWERVHLPPKWSKFVTDVKLVKDLHTTNFDQLHTYLEQHELHANEVRLLYLGVLDGQVVQTIIPNNAAFQTEDLDTYDSDCDDVSNAKEVLKANISNYGSDIISEVPNSETYLNDMENQKTQQANVQDTNLQAQQDSMILSVIEQIINHLRISNPTFESSNIPPCKHWKSQLPTKVSLVNASLKNLKFHLARFDSMVKRRTTPDARTEGEWGFEHTKAIFNNEIIPFLKSLKDNFNVFDKDLLNEIMEVQTVFDQIDAAVQ
ncbi:hypothetical protein Tco_1376572 [Tanacetum coccineum]